MDLIDIYLRARGTAEQVFIKRKLGGMGDTGDGEGNKQGLPMFSSQEKGNRNKRKFLSEFSLDPPSNSSSSSSLTEFPRYEALEEKYKHVKGILESLGEMSEKAKEELDWSKFPEWKDSMIPFMEELIIKQLTQTFHDAIKKVVELEYSEEMAECAVLRSGPYFGAKSLLLNIVEGALEYLKGDKEFDTSKGHMFEDLENLVEYTMLEMTCILREVNPALSVVDAMWALLLFDMDLVKACSVKGDLHKFLMDEGVIGASSTGSSTLDQQVNLEPQKSELTASGSKSENVLPIFGSQLAREVQKNEKESGVSVQVTGGKSIVDTKENIKSAVEAALMEGIGRKGGVNNSKRDLLRQKKFYFEKNNKGRLSKGAFKAKVTSLGGPSDGVSPKNPLTEAKSKTQMPMPQDKEKSTQNTHVNTPSPPKTAGDYCAGIPYDESQGKYVAQDGKDEIILAAVARMEALCKEVQSWNDWANEKVMQVAHTLRKDQAELKTLRLEKEELDKFLKEKQLLEENTVKRLSEMENALTSAMGQVALADSTSRRLVAENSILNERMVDFGKKWYQESVKLEEAMLKEEETSKKCQLIGPEKALLQKELTTLKCKASALQKKLEKPKGFINQFEAQRAYEERVKNKILSQIENIRKEKEHIEAVAKAEEERTEENAKKELQKHKEDMRKMEEEISGLKLETEARKIAELRKSARWQPSQHPKRLPVFRNNFGGGSSLKQEHECVMCLTEEMSVIFLPCAHQVLCVDCNVIHEKQGMKECPSCRTPIQMRFNARFTP